MLERSNIPSLRPPHVLKWFALMAKLFYRDMADSETCPFCKEDLSTLLSPRRLPCKHVGSLSCLNQWIRDGVISCPICRYIFVTSVSICFQFVLDNTVSFTYRSVIEFWFIYVVRWGQVARIAHPNAMVIGPRHNLTRTTLLPKFHICLK